MNLQIALARVTQRPGPEKVRCGNESFIPNLARTSQLRRAQFEGIQAKLSPDSPDWKGESGREPTHLNNSRISRAHHRLFLRLSVSRAVSIKFQPYGPGTAAETPLRVM